MTRTDILPKSELRDLRRRLNTITRAAGGSMHHIPMRQQTLIESVKRQRALVIKYGARRAKRLGAAEILQRAIRMQFTILTGEIPRQFAAPIDDCQDPLAENQQTDEEDVDATATLLSQMSIPSDDDTRESNNTH